MSKKRFFALIITFMLVVFSYLLFNIVHRKTSLVLDSTSPANASKKVSRVTPITFTFNKELDQKTKDSFSIKPSIEGSVSVSGNRLIFDPSSTYSLNTSYVAQIKSPISKNGQTSRPVTIKFFVTYVPYNELPPDQQKAEIDKTDAIQKKYPILSKLPYENDHFKITFSFNEINKLFINVTLYAIINGPSDYESYKQQLQDYKAEALKYLSNNGADTNALNILFTPAV